MRLGKLGDMMYASFIIKKIRKAYPHLKIGLLTLPRSRGLFEFNKDIDYLFIWQPLTLPFFCIWQRLKKWDLLIDLNDDASRRSILALKLLNPKHSVAFYNEKTKNSFEYTVKTFSKAKSHLIKRIAKILDFFGISYNCRELRPVLYTDENMIKELKKEKNKIACKDGFLISVNISAGHISRYWQNENWINLIKELLKFSSKIKIWILSSPKDKKIKKYIIEKIGDNRVFELSKNDLHYFLSAIAVSDLLISPDTSAIHCACGFGTPVIGLYPEPYWNFVSFKPIGVKNIVIRSKKGGVDSIGFNEVKKKTINFLKKNM